MPIKRVIKGQAIELAADDWNQIGDAVDVVNLGDEYSNPRTFLSRMANVTGAEIPWLGFGQLKVPIDKDTPDVVEQRTYAIENPTGDRADIPKIAFTSTSLPDSAPQSAYPEGFCWVRLNVNDAAHQYASPVLNDVKEMESGGMGYRIVWKEAAGTGSTRAIIRTSHYGFTMVAGTLDEPLNAGGSAVLTVTDGTLNDSDKYTVHDFFGETVGQGVKCWALHLRPDKCYVIAAECEESADPGGPVNP